VSRTYIGFFVALLGIVLLGVGIKNHSKLWAGVQTKTVVVNQSTKQEEVSDNDTAETGELRVEHRWHYVDKGCAKDESKCSPVGEYQFRDKSNKIWVMKFCNQPPPNIKENSVVNITYMKKDQPDCTIFVNAGIIWEPLK
jgi:hypothetical protein